MSLRWLTLSLVAFLLVSALAWAGYSRLGSESTPSSVSVTESAPPKTTTIALPSKTNNAWEMTPFKLKGLDGKTHSLDEWKGKVIVLNFWASWCAPCQYEIKELIALQNEYGDKGLQVVSLGLDEERKLRNVKRTLGINYPVLVAEPAENTDLLVEWGNEKQIVPYTVVIDKNGRIVYIHRGQLTRDTFSDFILPLLG